MREMIDVGEGCEEGASRLTTIPLTQIVEESVLTFESDDVVREKKKSSELGADDGDGEVGSERLMSASKIHNLLTSNPFSPALTCLNVTRLGHHCQRIQVTCC